MEQTFRQVGLLIPALLSSHTVTNIAEPKSLARNNLQHSIDSSHRFLPSSIPPLRSLPSSPPDYPYTFALVLDDLDRAERILPYTLPLFVPHTQQEDLLAKTRCYAFHERRTACIASRIMACWFFSPRYFLFSQARFERSSNDGN